MVQAPLGPFKSVQTNFGASLRKSRRSSLCTLSSGMCLIPYALSSLFLETSRCLASGVGVKSRVKQGSPNFQGLLGDLGGGGGWGQCEQAATVSCVCVCLCVVCGHSCTLPCTFDPSGFLVQMPRSWWAGQELNRGLYCSYLLGVEKAQRLGRGLSWNVGCRGPLRAAERGGPHMDAYWPI